MRVADFDFHLPDELIAHYPGAQRSACRLLALDGDKGALRHGVFTDLPGWLNPGDLLVFNNTRVIPARLYGRKASGGKIELLIERLQDAHRALAHIRASKAPKPGDVLRLGDDESVGARVLARHGALFEVAFDDPRPLLALLEQIGHIPLPPYIKRPDEDMDRERYQTVYSTTPGAVAAPTAGLHFDQSLLAALRQKGVEQAFLTLHVGAGTFQPVRVAQVHQHQMHAEYADVPEQVVNAIHACKARGNKVVAVGTTSLRALESAGQFFAGEPCSGERFAAESSSCAPFSSGQQPSGGQLLAPFAGDTRIFIYPGYQFRVVDALITNFHLPQSTLFMLVCAFAGYRQTLNAYQQAITRRYRFFSYGDAMYLTCNPHPDLPL